MQTKFNIIGHKLVPHHEILSDKETKDLLAKFDIGTEQLPRVLDTDPAVLAIGAKPGQIIKITRESRTAKFATAYRLVVKSDS